MDADSRVKLAEIGGDIKRIFDFITRQADDTKRIDGRLNHHAERITALEASNNRQEGQQTGVNKTVKVMWAVLGGGGATIVTGIAAIVARSRGL